MCLKPQNRACFLQDNQFEGSPVYVYLQNECFPIYLLGIPMNVCWNPQNRAQFSYRWTSWGVTCLRFNCKMNVFLSISLESPRIYVETLRTGFVFLRWSIWGLTCQGLSEKWIFPIYLLGILMNMCWNPQNWTCFSKMINLRGHMPRFTLKMHIFPSISLETK